MNAQKMTAQTSSKSTKVISDVKMKNWQDNDVVGSGTVTDDGKYVVSAIGRVMGDTWAKSKNNANVEFETEFRFDVAVSEMDGEKQGSSLIPFLAMRGTTIKTSFGTRMILGGVDNDSKPKYRTLSVSGELWKTMQLECSRAAEVALDGEIDGKLQPLAAAGLFIVNADKLQKAKEIVRKRRQQYAATQAALPTAQVVGQPDSAAAAALDAIADGQAKA